MAVSYKTLVLFLLAFLFLMYPCIDPVKQTWSLLELHLCHRIWMDRLYRSQWVASAIVLWHCAIPIFSMSSDNLGFGYVPLTAKYIDSSWIMAFLISIQSSSLIPGPDNSSNVTLFLWLSDSVPMWYSGASSSCAFSLSLLSPVIAVSDDTLPPGFDSWLSLASWSSVNWIRWFSRS